MAIETSVVKEMLIDAFDLEQTIEEVSDDTAIVGEGLELDSVDVLEIVVQVKKRFSVEIKNDDFEKSDFADIKNLTALINRLA